MTFETALLPLVLCASLGSLLVLLGYAMWSAEPEPQPVPVKVTVDDQVRATRRHDGSGCGRHDS
jgi:hypothetical protein